MNKKNAHAEAHDALFEAILSLENIDECRAFFDDICTIKELQDLSLRLRVAKMLSEGKNYQEICTATGASTATICRVNKCLTYGEGYRAVLDKAKGQQGE
jgi:TrpR-related protein YerC/YecD